jgi:hypothetical protein
VPISTMGREFPRGQSHSSVAYAASNRDNRTAEIHKCRLRRLATRLIMTSEASVTSTTVTGG